MQLRQLLLALAVLCAATISVLAEASGMPASEPSKQSPDMAQMEEFLKMLEREEAVKKATEGAKQSEEKASDFSNFDYSAENWSLDGDDASYSDYTPSDDEL